MWREVASVRWRERLERWRSSGLSIRAFCRREGIGEPGFYAWRKRLAPVRDLSVSHFERSGVSFAAVDVLADATTPCRCRDHVARGEQVEIVLPCGVLIRVGTGVAESWLRSVLRLVIEEAVAC